LSNNVKNTVAPAGQLLHLALKPHKDDPLASRAPPTIETPLTRSKLSQSLA